MLSLGPSQYNYNLITVSRYWKRPMSLFANYQWSLQLTADVPMLSKLAKVRGTPREVFLRYNTVKVLLVSGSYPACIS